MPTLDIAYELEEKSHEAKMEEIKATIKECESIDWGDEFDFDPDADNPNVAGSDAWWAEQEFFRDQFLYVNHD